MTAEEWLLASNIESLRKNNLTVERTNRQGRFTFFVAFVTLVIAIGLSLQVQARNGRLDTIDHSVKDLQNSVKEIKQVADNVKKSQGGSAAFNEAIRTGLDKIDRLCQQTNCDKENP